MDPFRLDAFELQSPLGRGAMGEVWRGRHLYQDVPVAIKVLNSELLRDTWALEAFTNEVRAAAKLNHPGIMMLLDQGMVSQENAAASDGRLQEGSPYLVMELVEGRPLHHWAGRLSWPTIHSVLSQLLDALAHSHARGVIHRDIKPGNVLVEVDERKDRMDPERLQITLTDFGLAQALKRHSSADHQVAGTPAYMAPEQLRGRWRDQGPWTDLYSLGCLGWAMTTGNPPFGRKRPIEELCHDHLHLQPPPLDSVAPIPRDLEAWLRRLLQKRPEERFTRAADALHCLNQIGGSLLPSSAKELRTQLAGEATRPNIPVNIAMGPDDAALLDDCSTQEDAVSEISTRILDIQRIASKPAPSALPSRLLPPIEVQPAPIPRSWERQPRLLARRARGVGLSLYGLSPVPMVNRFEERDALWTTLREVEQTGETRIVLLEGPAGCGKTRLAQWLCEEANARAGLTILHATHSALPEPANGLPPMLTRALRCRGLERPELVQRLAQVLPRIGLAELDEVHALAELIMPSNDSDQEQGIRTIRFHDARERHHLLRRVLKRVGGPGRRDEPTRQVILWIDDLQWGQDAILFTQSLLHQQDLNSAPIMVVGTVQMGALDEREEEALLLQELRSRPETKSLNIEPLASAHHRELINSLLGNEGQLVERVARRTAGNPLFAVQLVGDWVERGVLLTGPGGVVLQPGAEVQLPDNLHAIWNSRIDRFLNQQENKAGQALEVAATLGDKVDRREWRAAAERLGVRPSASLVAGLIRHRLVMADPEGQGWSFSHPMLRECLERRARVSRRASQVHLACARMLQERIDNRPGSAERIGTHLLRGGEALEALAYFLRAAEEAFSQGAFHHVNTLLHEWDEAMVAEGMPASEPMWGQGWLLRGRVLRALVRMDEARQVIERAMRVAEEQGWPDIVAACLCEEGVILYRMGEGERSWKRLRKAESRAQKIGDDELLATVLNWQGDIQTGLGRLDEAVRIFEKCRVIAARTGNTAQEAEAWFQLGRVDKQAGRLDEANTHLSRSLELFESVGARWGSSKTINELGEIARLSNRLTEAAGHYSEALERMEELGLPEATIPRLNLAMVMMKQGEFSQAMPLVEHAHQNFVRSSTSYRQGITHLMILICSIGQDDWSDWDHHLSQSRLLLADTSYVDVDVALWATEAGDMAIKANHIDRARQAWDLAMDQWQGLDRPQEAEQIRGRLLEGRVPED